MTRKELLRYVNYNSETGVFRWRDDAPLGHYHLYLRGRIAGGLNSFGYRRIWICGCEYRASRLAWFIMTGRWPKFEVDHKNNKRDDNRWSNLRLASRSDNGCNIRSSGKNRSGYKGVHWDKQAKKWRTELQVNGQRVFVACFVDIEDAARAYNDAASIYHGRFAKFNWLAPVIKEIDLGCRPSILD